MQNHNTREEGGERKIVPLFAQPRSYLHYVEHEKTRWPGVKESRDRDPLCRVKMILNEAGDEY